MPRTSAIGAAVTAQNIHAAHIDTLAADVAEVYEATGLSSKYPFASTPGAGPLLLHLWRKASAFTFGSSPVTSDGYLRTPAGAPWGADSVAGLPRDRRVATTAVATGTAANTLVLNRLFILPAFAAAATVTQVVAEVGFAFRTTNASYTATLDKVGLQVVKIAADGTETNIGSEVFETTTATEGAATYEHAQRYLSSASLSGAIATTERLGIRLKLYGHSSNASGGVEAGVCSTVTVEDDADPTGWPYLLQLAGTPVAVWLT